MRVILVPVADRPECRHALRAAFDLAGRVGAGVTGCHVRPHRKESTGSDFDHVPVRVAGEDEVAAGDRTVNPELHSSAAAKLFADLAADSDFDLRRRPTLGKERQALWHESVGTPERVLAIAGPLSDCIVVSRPRRKSRGPGRRFLLASLVYGGRPVLVLPAGSRRSLGKRVVIGWDQSVSAARSVTAALPLLQTAESVTLVSCGPDNRPGPKLTALAGYLLQCGVASESVQTKGRSVEKELTAVYKDTHADLLVTGAYSRGNIRDLVFGSVTDHLLHHSNARVFTMHG